MSGDKVYDAFHAGEHEQITAYCLQDVEVVRAILKVFLTQHASAS